MQGPERLNDRVSSVEVGLMSLLDIGVLVVLAMILIPLSVLAVASEYWGKRG